MSYLCCGDVKTTSANSTGPSVCGEECPDPRFCQACGSKEVLDQEVDFILMTTYRETDLDQDPCIFPKCGHIMAMSSMDGIMDMSKHYVMEETTTGQAHPVALAAASLPFDMHDAKACPQCRGSLRNVARYGRIVRRAVLDESTKRLVSWTSQKHSELALRIINEKEGLERGVWLAKGSDGAAAGVWKQLYRPGVSGSTIKKLLRSTASRRMDNFLKLRGDIHKFSQKVAQDEAPFQRVADLVRFARNRRAGEASVDGEDQALQFAFDETVIQVGGQVQAQLLLMRCDILALEGFAQFLDKATLQDKLAVQMGSSNSSSVSPTVSAFNSLSDTFASKGFDVLLSDCGAAIATARSSKRVRQEVEGYILHAQLCLVLRRLVGLQPKTDDKKESEPGNSEDGTAVAGEGSQDGKKNRSGPESDTRTRLKDTGLEHLAAARRLVRAHPSTKLLEAELESTEKALLELPFYEQVTADELRAVYQAMMNEFRSSGHWYTCANGHPFTVGECSRPMQETRCPECGAAVGGRNHMFADGVQRANDMEALGRGVGRMAL